MKLSWLYLLLLTATLASTAHAEPVITGGGVDTNGGDMCEDRFKIVRDDLKSWILAGGSQGLQLPSKIALDRYNRTMLQKIGEAVISCTDQTIYVGQAEKTCKNFRAESGSVSIVCNINRFLNTPQSDQYILVHHEYAGLSGFETNVGESSTYTISNQLSGFLENTIEQHLVVKPTADPTDPFDPTSCTGPAITVKEATRYFQPGTALSTPVGSSKFFQRSRTCNTLTGCAAWEVHEPEFFYSLSYGGYGKVAYPQPQNGGAISFSTKLGEIYLDFPFPVGDSAKCGIATEASMACTEISVAMGAHDLSVPVYYPGIDNNSAQDRFALSGRVTNHCLRLSSSSATTGSSSGTFYQFETVWLGQF